MKKNFTKFIAVTVALTLISGSMAACGTKQGTDSSSATPASSSPAIGAPTAITYPLKTDVTLSYWSPLGSNLAQQYQTWGEAPGAKELEKKTGVKIKYMHPVVGQEKDQFNVMIASGEYPDIIETNWIDRYPGGPDKAIQDNVILKLNDLIANNAPNLKKYLDEDKELNKMVKTDANNYYVFPMIRKTEEQMVFAGPMVRKDWLDELGLSIPETMDDWYVTLTAFKEKKGATAPMIIRNYSTGPNWYNAFFGAYGLWYGNNGGFYLDDNGKVQYSATDPRFKEVLTTLNKWVAEGLLDKDFPLSDQKAMDEKMLNGKSGAAIYLAGGGLNKWQQSVPTKDPNFNMVAAPYPVLKKGDIAFSGQGEDKYNHQYSAVITTSCKNPEIAAQWLDFGYTREGELIFNMGVEGESYTLDKDGKAHLTDLIMKNPEGKDYSTMLTRYQKVNGPHPQSTDILESYNRPANFKETIIWSKTDAKKHKLPTFLSYTDEENKELIKIENDLTNYNSEMLVKFLMGQEPISNFDKFVEKCNSLGVERAKEIYTAALERYNKR